MAKLRLKTLLIGWAVLLVPAVGCANPAFQAWYTQLETKGVAVSAGLWDISTGKLLEGRQADTALIPASTTKVVSSYALMKLQKPNMQVETDVWGDRRGKVVQGDVIFKGAGDPFLVNERLWVLAQDLKKQGIQKVCGKVRLDQRAFDGCYYGQGWENTTADTTPPIAPLSVNFNRDDKGRICHEPEKLAVGVITDIFRQAGIQVVGGKTREGHLSKLATLKSPPLRTLVNDINKYSNNFMVEMLVKQLGDGHWQRGIGKIQGYYQSTLGITKDKLMLTDGSGLSKLNRLSASTLAAILRTAWWDFEVGPEWVASLKVAGGEPWVQKHMDPQLSWRVRCKTGHLDKVNSVCGYVQLPTGAVRVFAILLNGECDDQDCWSQVLRWAQGG